MDQEPYVPYEVTSDDGCSDGYEPFEPSDASDSDEEGGEGEFARLLGKRKRPWSERGLGVDWMLEMEAARAARAACMRRRVLQAGRGTKRREMMSEPSRPPNARTRAAGE